MKHFAAAIVLCSALTPMPLLAQEEGEGKSLMQRGMELFFEGFMKEVEPLADELKDLAEEIEPNLRELAEKMGPALDDLAGKIDDMNNYEAPVILPNGDIIIRRKPDAPEPSLPNGEIEI